MTNRWRDMAFGIKGILSLIEVYNFFVYFENFPILIWIIGSNEYGIFTNNGIMYTIKNLQRKYNIGVINTICIFETSILVKFSDLNWKENNKKQRGI